MNFCPHCGSAVSVQDERCPKCGSAIAAEEEASGKKDAAFQNRSLKKTVIGIIGPSAAAEAMGAGGPRVTSKPTLVGIPIASPGAPAESPSDRAKGDPANAVAQAAAQANAVA